MNIAQQMSHTEGNNLDFIIPKRISTNNYQYEKFPFYFMLSNQKPCFLKHQLIQVQLFLFQNLEGHQYTRPFSFHIYK
uniref:Uncharacterized protein n=1 Tax=Physcomitrium patens TaxID=3218 RepID=A0A2K1IBD8_PHYPA|nr:hypothetical protein PHYPA_030081 [Physcomitrium patens]